MLDSLRLRLTFWHLVVLALLQTLLCLCIYIYIAVHLRRQVDGFLQSALTSMSGALAEQPALPGEALPARIERALRTLHHTETPMAVYAAGGAVLGERPSSAASITPFFARPSAGTAYMQTPRRPELRLGSRRVAVTPFQDAATGQTLYLADSISMFSRTDELLTARVAFLLGIPIMLLLNGVAGFTLIGRALAPAVQMAERARTIGADNMTERLGGSARSDELGQLASALNELLDRLDAAQTTERQFMADAAHELRTPLSVAQNAVAVALLSKPEAEDEYGPSLLLIDGHLKRLARSVNDVFRLARADAGFRSAHKTRIFLDEVLAEAVHAGQLLARAKSITITLETPHPVPYLGDELMLHEMTLNLLENAIKYTPAGGHVDVRLGVEGGAAKIAITDSGVGIDEQDRDRIFKRFYRGRPAFGGAQETIEGTGLGLAIAQGIAASHDGTIELQASSREGSTFLITLGNTAVQSEV